MNSYERVMAAIAGKPHDRTPNVNILMQFAAREIGCKYGRYMTDWRNLVRGNLECAEKYGIDIVTVMQGPMSEAHDLGAKVVFPEDDVSYASEPLLRDHADILKLKVVEPYDGGTMGNAVNAIAEYRRQVGGKIPIAGWVEGCFAQAADLMGVTEFLTNLADPDCEDMLTDLFEFLLEQELCYAAAQVKAGADIIGVGDAIASVAGPSLYKRLAADYESRLLSGIKRMGVKTKLHICGNIQPLLSDIPVEYCDVVDIDWMVSLADAVRIFDGRCAVSGNYDPVTVLLSGSADDVDAAVRRCAGIAGARYLTSAGCEVPRHTPVENLMQVHETVCEIGEIA